jgi:hypothetical protein
VSRNCLSEDGIATLRATGVSIIADKQHDLSDENYLFEVDIE